MEGREAKDRLYEQFAAVAKAVASPRRVELVELVAQRERTVEWLADATGMRITNTSAHLQVLRRCGLVETRRDGTKIYYRVAGDHVVALLVSIRTVAEERLAEVDRVVRTYFDARDGMEPVSPDELLDRVHRGDVVVLDVRPPEEFEAGHIPGALSIPLDDLDEALKKLSKRTEIVAYCRGPYCVLAPLAVERLRARGFRARRLEEGMPEWRLRGLPVETGAA